MRTRAALAALAIATVGLGAVGCSAEVSTGKTVDTDKAEELIGSGLSEQLGGEITVSCPDDVKAEKGATFDCEATSPDGEKANVTVTQKDDEGNVSWELG